MFFVHLGFQEKRKNVEQEIKSAGARDTMNLFIYPLFFSKSMLKENCRESYVEFADRKMECEVWQRRERRGRYHLSLSLSSPKEYQCETIFCEVSGERMIMITFLFLSSLAS